MSTSTDSSVAGGGEQGDRDARTRQSRIGLSLAIAIISAWAIVHVYGVFFYRWSEWSVLTAPLLAGLAAWLYVGIVIVAHDCMHGSLVPFRPAINRAIGRLCLILYAGFSFDELNRKHHLHHRHSGTVGDPDFDPTPPHGIAHWYFRFFLEYFTWRQFLFFAVVGTVYMHVLGVSPANLIVFWSLPAIVSSMQLFYFGTYLPHRPAPEPFADRHRARTNNYGWWVSLLTCFHFGYHHEHHLRPEVPWWRLPRVHAAMGKRA